MVHRSPQAFDRLTTARFHISVILALLPVLASAVVHGGGAVVLTATLAVGTATLADQLFQLIRPIRGPWDWAPVLWGVLLTLLLPLNVPFFFPVVGALVAVSIKALLGRSGAPWINPVLVAWAFLQVSWPNWFGPLGPLTRGAPSGIDLQTTDWLNSNFFSWLSVQLPVGYVDLVLGIGRPEATIAAGAGGIFLLAATVFLLGRGLIPWQVPASFFVAFVVPSLLAGSDALHQIFAGSFLLNIFFLATDPSSRPLGRWSLIVYGSIAGLLAFLLRHWGTATDSVGYAVLLMNVLVPWIDQRFRRKSLNDFRLA